MLVQDGIVIIKALTALLKFANNFSNVDDPAFQ